MGLAFGLAESLGKLVGVGGTVERRTEHDAEIQHVQHDEFARHDLLLGQPRLHLGEMLSHGLVSAARHDDRLQNAVPTDISSL